MPASRFAAWAGALTKTGVTRVTEVTETGNPTLAAILRGPTEVTRRAVPEVTWVTAPSSSSREVTQVTHGTEAGVTEERPLDQCGNPGNPSNPENNGYPPTAKVAAHRARAPWRPIEEERAAIVEYEAGIPRAWAEGLARLDPDRPPPGVPPKRWLQFVDDCGLFVDSPFCAVAAALDWSSLDLFGADRKKPFARIDQTGLLWLLNGDRLIALTENTATIETRTGARQTYRRKPNQPGRVLAWEFAPCESGPSHVD
jgi:hypothetical protein